MQFIVTKGIDPEIVAEESNGRSCHPHQHYGEGSELVVTIDRVTGDPTMTIDAKEVEPDVMGDLLGRIAAQTAKQVMIQKIREAERDALFDEYMEMKWQLVTGTVSRVDGGRSVTVNLGKVEGILPRSGDSGEEHRNGEPLTIILEVRKVGNRVRIVLSRSHREMVRRLFEVEIPEIAENVIEVRSLAREAGFIGQKSLSAVSTPKSTLSERASVSVSRRRILLISLTNSMVKG
ncbi:MAG: NusA N-terminal domain-containing protein [Planctomycetaceae bacterium]